jgi:peptidoglycan/LPS O-acetylase OafA/YrhL
LRLEPLKEFIFYNLFVISIYLGGVPSHNPDFQVLQKSRGWYYLSFLKPQAVFDYKWFYLFWAATFLVASIPRISWLKGFFETRFNQYLGRISFALYLVHGPVLRILGDRLYVATGWSRESHAIGLHDWIDIFPLSKTGPLGLELSFLAPHLIILPVTLWLAEIATKLLDKPSVKFAQWAYGRSLAPSAKS